MKYGHVRSLPRSRSARNSRRKLQDRATPAELALRSALHKAGEPHRFQYPIYTAEAPTGYFVVDFYLPRRGLLVELDGKPHATEQGRWNDLLRKEAIRVVRPELRMVRYWNRQVLDDPAAVVSELRTA